MPVDRLVLIIVCVTAGALVTGWLAFMILAGFHVPYLWLTFIPAAVVGYILWRVLAERLGNKTEDHYDRMEH